MSDDIQLASIRSIYLRSGEFTARGMPITELRLKDQPDPFVADPNGQYEVGQIYAQVYRLVRPRHPWPVLLWHGGGLTGSLWESTAAGEQGWLSWFLRAGFDVVVSDAIGLGRSSWAPDFATYSNMQFRTKRELWDLLRLGSAGSYAADPAKRQSHTGSRFPIATFDAFSCRVVPRWVGNETAMQYAYDQLVENAGPCIIVAHSSAARFAMSIALRKRGAIKAIVAIEPSVLVGQELPLGVDVPLMSPCLSLFGDFLAESPYWSSLRRHLQDQHLLMLASGMDATLIDLPAIGIEGNSHCPMNDENAVDVASVIGDWLDRVLNDRPREETYHQATLKCVV
jgi:pimeloyl-ACP methyl ester carboxylesterase